MKRYLLAVLILLTGCATTNWSQVGTDLISDVQAGTVAASDAFAAYQAVNQQLTTANVTTGKLSVTKVLAAAEAITGTVGSSSLQTAVSSLVTDANQTISDLKGSSTTSVIQAVSQQGAGTVTTIAALPGASK